MYTSLVALDNLWRSQCFIYGEKNIKSQHDVLTCNLEKTGEYTLRQACNKLLKSTSTLLPSFLKTINFRNNAYLIYLFLPERALFHSTCQMLQV